MFVGLFYLTPMALIQRLAEHSSSGRIAIWKNTLHLIGAYPAVGCGLGGYESAMLRFKTTVLMNDLDYAHNDYLQYLGELGVLGFLIGAVLFGALVVRPCEPPAPDRDRAGSDSVAPARSRPSWLTVSSISISMFRPMRLLSRGSPGCRRDCHYLGNGKTGFLLKFCQSQ